MEEKVLVSFKLKKSTIEGLKELVRQKYPHKFRGPLSQEVELAILNWVSAHKHTNAQNSEQEKIHQPNPPPRCFKVYTEVKKKLVAKGLEYQCTTEQLVKAIRETGRLDPRTIRRWMKDFKDFGLIKPIGVNVWEFI